jgi:murein DD-endopeptidase MepM/ murein hydrolase activator NlpD
MTEMAANGSPAPLIPVARVVAAPFTDVEEVLASQGLLGPVHAAYRQTPGDTGQGPDFLGLAGLNLRPPLSRGPVVTPAIELAQPVDIVTVKRGQTLMAILTDAGLSRVEADRAVRALRPVFDPRRLAIGQRLLVQLRDGTGDRRLARLLIELDVAKEIELTRNDDGALVAVTVEKPLYPWLRTAVLDIQSSLYAAASGTDLPDVVMRRAVRVLSYQVDFQRDIQPGDRLELLYEQKVTRDGEVAKDGDVVMARLSVNGDQIDVYRYIDSYGDPDYFDTQGKSLRSGLMRTPIEGARLSSGFGDRRHPILGYNKMHEGVDFAAPTGTPIFAAGNGVIERIGWFGSYGRYVRIRHTETISTAYAHLSRFAAGLKRGSRVKQGEVIGRVGSSGRSTGPHLHYEVIQSGRQVNPLSVTLPAGRELKGQELARFQQVRAALEQQYAGTVPFNQLADSRR